MFNSSIDLLFANATPGNDKPGAYLPAKDGSPLIKLLKEGVTIEDDDNDSFEENQIQQQAPKQEIKVKQTFGLDAVIVSEPQSKAKVRPPTLREVMLDPDFLDELRGGNKEIEKFLDADKILLMANYLIVEPQLEDDPDRCYKLPFIACEFFTSEVNAVTRHLFCKVPIRVDERSDSFQQNISEKLPIFDKLISFFGSSTEDCEIKQNLNPTLGGYINKVMSFWLIKRTEQFLGYLCMQKNFVKQLFNHLYLTHCVTDLIVRLCTVQEICGVDQQLYQSLRSNVVQYSINMLDQHSGDDFLTEQIFEILTNITRKCYLMHNPKAFFDEVMSPFRFLPLLEFAFDGGQHTKQGAEFLKLFLYNLFVSEPQKACIDIMETNFGFQVTTVAGMQVGGETPQPGMDLGDDLQPVKKCNSGENKKEELEINIDTTSSKKASAVSPRKNDPTDQVSGAKDEISVVKQEEMAKKTLMQTKKRIYKKIDLSTILAQQILTVIFRFEVILANVDTPMMIRIKLYELLSVLIRLDHKLINQALCEQEQLVEILINDFDRFECNSLILGILTQIIEDITDQRSAPDLLKKLYVKHGLITFFAKRLSCTDYAKKQNERKDIYAFIHGIATGLEAISHPLSIHEIMPGSNRLFRKLVPQLEPAWTALIKATQADQAILAKTPEDEAIKGRLAEYHENRKALRPDSTKNHTNQLSRAPQNRRHDSEEQINTSAIKAGFEETKSAKRPFNML